MHKGLRLTFARDYLFDSPSGAAAAVLGRTANGWIEWKNAEGRTLSQVKRVPRESPNILSEQQASEIRAKHAELEREGKLQSIADLERQYRVFRERLGPNVLAGLDGERLLDMIMILQTKTGLHTGSSTRAMTSSNHLGSAASQAGAR